MTQIPLRTSKAITTFTSLATLLVIMCHTDDVMQPEARSALVRYLGGSFSDANVCNFFFLSGFLLARHSGEEGWWRKAILSRLRSLAVPYLAWCLAYFFLSGHFIDMVYFVHGNDTFTAVGEIVRLTRRVFGLGFLLPPYDFPLWYVKTLFYFVIVSVLAFPLFLSTRRGFVISLATLIAFFVVGHYSHLDIMPYFGHCFHLLGFCAFLIGAYCAIHGIATFPEKMASVNPFVPLAIWIIISVICFVSPPYVNAFAILFEPINIAVAVFCLVWISFTVKWGVSDAIVKCTFFVYAGHLIVLKSVIRTPLLREMPSLFVFVVLVIAAISVCTLGAHAMYWACPRLAMLFSGGRYERKRSA